MQQLLGGGALADRTGAAAQRAAEKLSVRVLKPWGSLAAGNELLRLGDSVGEVRHPDTDPRHTSMQLLERLGVTGR